MIILAMDTSGPVAGVAVMKDGALVCEAAAVNKMTHSVNMMPMVEEALVLELPMRFMCSEDCKGICYICGANRNIAPCTCQEGGERQNPFSALRELLTEDEEV